MQTIVLHDYSFVLQKYSDTLHVQRINFRNQPQGCKEGHTRIRLHAHAHAHAHADAL